MAITVTCAQCGLCITYDSHDAVVHYECGHVEHENCYFDRHPQVKICPKRRERSDTVVFKYVEITVLSYCY